MYVFWLLLFLSPLKYQYQYPLNQLFVSSDSEEKGASATVSPETVYKAQGNIKTSSSMRQYETKSLNYKTNQSCYTCHENDYLQ